MATAPKSNCADAPGKLVPLIDRNRCEAKGDCVPICPYNVFEIQDLSAPERAELSWKGSIKAYFHGYRQAYAVRADQCHACGLCVQACPEKAIKLRAA